MKLLFDDGDQHVGGYGTPDLRLHRVLARPQKALDAQMLLDPFEEQLHLPATLVQCGDDQRRQARVVGQNYQRFARGGVFETNTPQLLGVVLYPKPFSAMVWPQMTPVPRSVWDEYARRAFMPRLARVTKKAPA